MINNLKYIISTLILTFYTFLAHGQEKDPRWNADGEIEEAEFVIVKNNKKLELPGANRFFKPIKIDKRSFSESIVKYKLKEFDFTPNVILPKIKVSKVGQPTINKLWGNKITLGYGNFQSPYIDLSLANKRDKLYSYGFNFNHHSFGKGAIDDENSASGLTDIEAFGKIFGKKATSYASVNYQNDFNHFYGYQVSDTKPAADSIRQMFNRFSVKAGITGTDLDNPLSYTVETQFRNFTNDFDANERTFGLNGDFEYKLSEEEKIIIDLGGALSAYEDSTSINRNLLTLSPAFEKKISGIYLRAGFQLAIDNDTLTASNSSSVFPQINVRFPVSSSFDVYGGITGGKNFVSLNELTRDNPWIAKGQALVNSSNKLEIYGGINGKIQDKVSTQISFSAGNVDNMAFFVNSESDSSQFDLIYDNTSVFKFQVEVSYAFMEKASIKAGASFYGYDTDVLAEAWHKPTFEFMFGSKFNIYEKVILTPTLNVMGGIEGLNSQTMQSVELDPIVQLNLQAKYILSDRAGIYASFNNIIGENYQRYLNYQARGLQLNVGFNYSF